VLDSSFVNNIGTGANPVLIEGNLVASIRSLAVETDGGILVGGLFDSFDEAAAEGMIRLNADGSRNIVSRLSLPFDTGWNTEIHCSLVEDSGKMMVGGSLASSWTGSGFRSGTARLNSDGTRDNTFDPDAGAHADGATNQLQRVL